MKASCRPQISFPSTMSLLPKAKVILVTTKGEIEINLYPEQLPSLCRAFIENCVNKRFNGCNFGKITLETVEVAATDDTRPIAREFHSRLKFDGKGDVGLLNIDNNHKEGTKGGPKATANGFFITTKPCSEFNSQFVIIGKVSNTTIYNLIAILQGEMKPDSEEPLFPITITDTLVPVPFFKDVIEESNLFEKPVKPVKLVKPEIKKPKVTLRLDLEEDEDLEVTTFVMKSAHDVKKRDSNALPKRLQDLKNKDKKEKQKDVVISNNISTITSATDVFSDVAVTERKTKEESEETKRIPLNDNNVDKSTDFSEAIKSNVQETEARTKTVKTDPEQSTNQGTQSSECTKTNKRIQNSELTPKETNKPEKKIVNLRKPDPSIDPYDPEIDVAEDTITFKQLQNHFFKCR